jgi:hypothetical protein
MHMRMTSAQWLTGCLVILGATAGAAVTSPWAKRTFAPPPASATDAANAAKHTRTCITLSGKRFEWNFPNPPFGTLSCSD